MISVWDWVWRLGLSRAILRAMPRKHPRTDADVEKLAAEFRQRWTPAHGITPWLRRMGSRLQRMVRDESWAWADIGRAMTLAGITYESGKPWTGTLLMVKAAQARKQARDRLTRASVAPILPAAAPPLAAINTPSMPPATMRQLWLDQTDNTSEPGFALASFAVSEFAEAKPVQPEPVPASPPPVRPRVDADEILRRLQGGSTSTGKKD